MRKQGFQTYGRSQLPKQLACQVSIATSACSTVVINFRYHMKRLLVHWCPESASPPGGDSGLEEREAEALQQLDAEFAQHGVVRLQQSEFDHNFQNLWR